jgi:hypothetical protein
LLAVSAALVAVAGLVRLSWSTHSRDDAEPPVHHEIVSTSTVPSPADMPDARWLEGLRRGGGASLPEICAFLGQGIDGPVHWSQRSQDWQSFPTVRTTLLALLSEIGGSGAAVGARAVAFSTRDPLELALAARVLEEVEPGQDRARLIAAARRLLAQEPADPAPLLQLLAFCGATDAVPDIESVAANNWQAAEGAIAALTLLRSQGGEAALLNLWRRSDLPAGTRRHLAHALGVCAGDSETAKEELKRMFADDSIDPSLKHEGLTGLSTGEDYLDPRLLPRGAVVMAIPHSRWLMARLDVLDAVEPAVQDRVTAERLQQVRDELLADLERTQ